MREVPYLNAKGEVQRGTLFSSLTMAGDKTRPPDTHVIHFDGSFPYDTKGQPIAALRNDDTTRPMGNGLTAKHSFSCKPAGGYKDNFEKMTNYAAILAGPAAVVDPEASPRGFQPPDEDDDTVFVYKETASARIGIGELTQLLEQECVSIIGLGGTGSYVLDMVAKTPVSEIRIFDVDEFLTHNAFRAPGAAPLEKLREVPAKVDYYKEIYSHMHRNIIAHRTGISAENLDLLDGTTFAFLCMDAGEDKRRIVERLEEIGASFVDVGMGLELVDGTLGGILRTTASVPGHRDNFHSGKVSFDDDAADDLYASNIQVVELNALNALMAVIKWKKIIGFYRDLEGELHSTYTTDGNLLINEEGDEE